MRAAERLGFASAARALSGGRGRILKDLPEWARRARASWQNDGRRRPPFAVVPTNGRESVWDYPRPPQVVAEARRVEIRRDGHVVADSTRVLRVLETASPPTFYLPFADVRPNLLRPTAGGSRCEWKGEARYWDVVAGGRVVERAAWSYPRPFEDYARLADHVAFYPVDLECDLGGERVRAQPGGFYGGWVTDELVGPFKGEPGSESW